MFGVGTIFGFLTSAAVAQKWVDFYRAEVDENKVPCSLKSHPKRLQSKIPPVRLFYSPIDNTTLDKIVTHLNHTIKEFNIV